MSKMNRLANVHNKYQGDPKKVLCVCSAGLLRSPTTAVVLSQEPFNYNTRAVGISDEYALIEIDDVHCTWADEIVCMEQRHANHIMTNFDEECWENKIKVLNIPDNFKYRDPKLMEMITKNYTGDTLSNLAQDPIEFDDDF